jgi:hypothetical protein
MMFQLFPFCPGKNRWMGIRTKHVFGSKKAAYGVMLPENNNVLFSANSDVLKTENKDV